MTLSPSSEMPPVTVIIPCYNHGSFLQEAIDSVLQQTHPRTEVIVVDDGSTDNTREVAQQNPRVKYIYQRNKGLSAARNTGIRHSGGEYLVFLDADDFLYMDALEVNLKHLLQDEQLAFVSGSYNKVYTTSSKVVKVVRTPASNHYVHLLQSNYIGMHATVMYRRWVFQDFLFDTSLKACEDYDLYLRVSRTHPVLHHSHIIAAYRMHECNMSNNVNLMLRTAKLALKRQAKHLQSQEEQTAYEAGQAFWQEYYMGELYDRLAIKKKLSPGDFLALLRYDRFFLYEYLQQKRSEALLKWARKFIPSNIRRFLKVYVMKR